jgi:hypothetical protein
MSAPSADFRSRVAGIADLLRMAHPDAMVREALIAERIEVLDATTEWDRIAVFGSPAPTPAVLLLGLHVGLPSDPPSTHRIRVFEEDIRQAAQVRGWSVDDQIQDTLLHELEHHFAWCPDGHADCTEAERLATPVAAQVAKPP